MNAAIAQALPETTDELPDIDTAAYDALLTELRGTPVVVNVWAAWCTPCRDEAPVLADAARRHGTEVQFVGIDVQDSRSGAKDFIAEFGWTYPSFFDPAGAIMTDLGLVGPPGTFFYDRDGELVDSVRGLLSAEALERGIREIRR